MKKLCCTRPKAAIWPGSLGKSSAHSAIATARNGAGHRGAEEDHRQVAEHVEQLRLDPEEPQRQRVDHDGGEQRRRAQQDHDEVLPPARLAEGVQDLAIAQARCPAAIAPRK